MLRTKICGITNTEDALAAASLGAWALGFIFYKKSPRDIGGFKARKIIAALPPFVTPVGIFVDQKEGAVKDIAGFCGLRVLQFHGNESPAYCERFKAFKVIKAFRLGDKFNPDVLKTYKADAFLFDSYQPDTQGGTGKTFNWKLIKDAKNFGRPVILSGGINAQNVKEAVEAVSPYAVDVSSGVEESPGKKSKAAMQDFFGKLYLL